MKKWHKLAFGSLGRTVGCVGRGSGDSTFSSPHVTQMQNQEDYWKNRGDIRLKAALASSPPPYNQMGAWFAVF